MPKKSKRPCSYPGCPDLTYGRFCPVHEKQENKRYEKYDRGPAVRRRYGRAWKRIRDSYVQQHPLCELCQEKGLLVPTEEVHHRIPLAEGGPAADTGLTGRKIMVDTYGGLAAHGGGAFSGKDATKVDRSCAESPSENSGFSETNCVSAYQ